MTESQQRKFIERQRGRARRIRKSGLYSPALAQLERRAKQAGIDIFSKSTKMSEEDRERQLNLLWQFSRDKTSTLEGVKAQHVANILAVRKAKGEASEEEIEAILSKSPRQQWSWYRKQKDAQNEANFISDLWSILKGDYANYKYKEGGTQQVTNMDIKDLVDSAEYLGETESLNMISELSRYMESTDSPEYAEIYDILHPTAISKEKEELSIYGIPT